MSFFEWLWARICWPISSDDSLKIRDGICQFFVFLLLCNLKVFLAEASSFSASVTGSLIAFLCFSIKEHTSDRAVRTLVCGVHFNHTSLNDERRKRVSHSFYNLEYNVCGFFLLWLNMVGRQGDQDLHTEVQLDVGRRFESHSSVGYGYIPYFIKSESIWSLSTSVTMNSWGYSIRMVIFFLNCLT